MGLLSLIAAQRIAFTNTLNDVLDAWDEQELLLEEEKAGAARKGGPINLDTLGPAAALDHFRFTIGEIDQLVDVLDLPEQLKCPNGISEPARVALAMLLRRLAYPGRYADILLAFGWEKTRFSRVSRTTAAYLYHRWSHILYFDPNRLCPKKLTEFAAAIHAKGSPLSCCWGFVDGTLRRTARPVYNQRILYNGWKRIHALKHHSVVTPNGLHSHLFGPIEGRRHDETVYVLSGLSQLLDWYSNGPEGEPLVIYGDPAYGLLQHLISPFKGANITPEQLRFNVKMSKVHEAVEWGFGGVVQQFAFLDFHKNQRVLQQPVGVFYTVGILLYNANVILHGSQVSSYFNCPPPSLSEYFTGTAADALKQQEQGFHVDFSNTIPGVEIQEEDLGPGEELWVDPKGE